MEDLELKEIDDVLNNLVSDDIFEKMFLLTDTLKEISPKIFKRKFRMNNGQIKYRTIISYNPLYDVLNFDLRFGISTLNRLLKRNR